MHRVAVSSIQNFPGRLIKKFGGSSLEDPTSSQTPPTVPSTETTEAAGSGNEGPTSSDREKKHGKSISARNRKSPSSSSSGSKLSQRPAWSMSIAVEIKPSEYYQPLPGLSNNYNSALHNVGNNASSSRPSSSGLESCDVQEEKPKIRKKIKTYPIRQISKDDIVSEYSPEIYRPYKAPCLNPRTSSR